MSFPFISSVVFGLLSVGLIYNAVDLRQNTAILEQRRHALTGAPSSYDYDVTKLFDATNFVKIGEIGPAESRMAQLTLVLPVDDHLVGQVSKWAHRITANGEANAVELVCVTPRLANVLRQLTSIPDGVRITEFTVADSIRFARLSGIKVLPIAVLASNGQARAISIGDFTETQAEKLLGARSLNSGTIVLGGTPRASLLTKQDDITPLEKP